MRAVAFLVLVGCGRVGFSNRTDAANTGDGPVTDVDGLDSEDAFIGVCGDSICASASETCETCGDCNTRAFVCGNLTCDPGEDGATCDVDCGPSPRPTAWVTTESEIFTMINASRTSGRDCPSTSNMPVAPLAYSAELEELARAWSRLGALGGGNAVGCNGTTYVQLATDRGVTVAAAIGAFQSPSITATAAVNLWFVDGGRCPYVMNGAYTEIGVGYFEVSGQVGYAAFYIR